MVFLELASAMEQYFTDKSQTQVQYATAGLDNQIFISKYRLELPKEEELVKLIQSTL